MKKLLLLFVFVGSIALAQKTDSIIIGRWQMEKSEIMTLYKIYPDQVRFYANSELPAFILQPKKSSIATKLLEYTYVDFDTLNKHFLDKKYYRTKDQYYIHIFSGNFTKRYMFNEFILADPASTPDKNTEIMDQILSLYDVKKKKLK